MAKTTDELVPEVIPESLEGYFTQSRAELDVPVDFESAIAASGLTQEQLAYVGSIYEVLKNKSELINNPFFIRAYRFMSGDMGTFVIVYGVRKSDNKNFIITDGSTGVCRQLQSLYEQRIKAGHPTPFENVLIPNGLRESTYFIDEDGQPLPKGVTGKRTGVTYYIA